MNAVDLPGRLDDPTDHLFGLGDPGRLAVLGDIDLDNPALQRRLDMISTRTADQLGMPIGLVSLVLDTSQVFAGAHGIDGWLAAAGGTPVEWAFCARTVATARPYVVTDAANDPVQADNPLVTVDNVATYAGVPLVVDGQVIGAHCVMGNSPRSFTDDELAHLATAAAEVVDLLRRYRLPT